MTIGQATATVKGPAAVQKTACFRGAQGSTQTVPTRRADGVAPFTAPQLAPRRGDDRRGRRSRPGTFPDAAADPARAADAGSARSRVDPLTVGSSLGVLALARRRRVALVSRRGRDERYLGVTPGPRAGTGQEHTVSPGPAGRPRPDRRPVPAAEGHATRAARHADRRAGQRRRRHRHDRRPRRPRLPADRGGREAAAGSGPATGGS